MAELTIKVTQEITKELKSIAKGTPKEASKTMDKIGLHLKKAMRAVTPIGATNELYNKTDVFKSGPYVRYIYSTAKHFDFIVPGHKVYGPIFSEKQRRWWFWWLHNVLGGHYTRRTKGRTIPNDYPADALVRANKGIETELGMLIDYIIGD